MSCLTRHAALLTAALCALAIGVSPIHGAEQGFRDIFDGKTLQGWDGDPKFWRVEDGAIVGQTTKDNPTEGNTFIIWRGGEPADFELKAQWKLINGNSGIQFRSWEEPEKWGKWVIGGYQADIADNQFCGILYGERYRGILANRGERTVIGNDHRPKVVGSVGDPSELFKAIKMGDWNEYHIKAEGYHIQQWINGKLMCEVTDEDTQQRRSKGLIALQLHAGPPMKVMFRNIRLKELKPAGSAATSEPQTVAGSQCNAAGQCDGTLATCACLRAAMEAQQQARMFTVAETKPAKKKIVLIAGRPSHGYASHEHNAGCTLLAKWLNESGLPVEAVVYKNGWPKEPDALDGAATIVIFSDGGGGHPMLPHLKKVEELMNKGVGLACIHYAVEVPKGEAGDKLKQWIGGYFETHWSVNPHWRAEFTKFPKHPVANGVKPFFMDDEWYYHMRFMDNMDGVTPILTAVPPDSTRQGPDGPHSGNPTVRARKGMPEHVCWVRQRPDGGRGFGFTGGHWHWSWACDSFRTVVLNGIVWTAGLDVPPGGVPSKRPTLEELEANQDYSQPKNFDRERIRKLIEEWNSWKP